LSEEDFTIFEDPVKHVKDLYHEELKDLTKDSSSLEGAFESL
jgi:hypothetical protein